MENLDSETIAYIIGYFSRLMTEDERLALRYQMFLHKLDASENKEEKEKKMREKGWFASEEKSLTLLKNGIKALEENIVKRILSESRDKVFFNNCPQCGKLARTPQAKQCRYCGFDWH